MNNGWIPLRRGLLDHIISGNINASETATFVVLLLNADAATGKGTINGAVLRSFYTEMSKDTSQRVLASLQEKKLIWRDNPTHSKRAYAYWVNKFECTKGPNRLRITDLSQVFESNDIKYIKYVKPAHQVHHEMQHQVQHEMSDSYNTDNDTDPNNDTSLDHSVSRLSRNVKHKSVAQREADVSRKLRQEVVPVESVVPVVAHSVPVEANVPRSVPSAIKWRFGGDAGWIDESGRTVLFDDVNKRIAPLGLKWEGGEYLRAGNPVPWGEAVAEIEEGGKKWM